MERWEQWVRQFDDIRNWLRLDISIDYIVFTHAIDHTIRLLAVLDRKNYGLSELLSFHQIDALDLERRRACDDGYLATPN